MDEQTGLDETEKKPEIPRESPRRSLPMHIRMLGLRQVRYVIAVICHLLSMAALTLIFVLMFLRSVDVPIEKIEQRVREASVSALGFVFPDYIAEVTSVGLDFDPISKGWVKVEQIGLYDIVQERSITIDEFRLSPSIRGLLSGDFKFNYVGVSRADIQFKAAESEERTRFGYPINLLDIPTNILREGGEISIDEMVMVIKNHEDVELVALKELGANLTKTANGYDGRINARHVAQESGAFSFRVQRNNDTVSWQGNAREYKVTPDKKLGMDFDLDLVFENVPPYDLTEQSDNVRYPYRYLTKADGLLRAKFADWVGGGRFTFDPETKVLSLAEMSLSNLEYSFDGEVDVTIGDEMLIEGKEITMSYPTNLDQTFVDDLSFVGKLDLINRNFQLGELYVANAPFEIFAKGSVGFESKLQAQFTVQSPILTREQVIDYWPKDVGLKTFTWASANIEQGAFRDVRFDVLYADKLAFNLSMSGREVIVKPTKWFPRVHSDSAWLNFTNDQLLVKANTANTIDDGTTDIEFDDIQFWVPNLKIKPSIAELDAKFSGPLPDVIEALSSEPVSIPTRLNMAASRFGGQVNGSVGAEFSLKKGTKLSEIKLDVRSQVANFQLSNLINGKNLTASALNVNIDQNGMRILGNARLDALSGAVDMGQSFAKGAQPDIRVKGQASRQQLRSIGLNLPSMITGDGVGYDLKVSRSGQNVKFVGEADIRTLGLSFGSLGAPKVNGRAGSASFTANVSGKNVNIESLNVRSGEFRANGSIKVSNGKLAELNFPNVNWPGRYSGSLIMDGASRVILRNGTVNLSSMSSGGIGGASSGGSGKASNQEVIFQNTAIKLTNQLQLTNATGRVKLGSIITGDLDGRFGGNSPVHLNLGASRGETLATITTNDAGVMFRNAGLYSGLNGGNLVLKVRTTDRAGLYAGKIRITNSRLSNSNTTGQLLQAASIFGALNNKGPSLNEIGGDLLITADRIDLFSGHAYGPEIGITLGGSYGVKSKSVNVAGVLTPAYLLNGALQHIPGLGELLGGNIGEGVFGVTYQITGQSPNYAIHANPLSLLTPGKLREIWSYVPQSRTISPHYRVD